MNYPHYATMRFDVEDIVIKEIKEQHVIMSFWVENRDEYLKALKGLFSRQWYARDIADYYYIKVDNSKYISGYLIGYHIDVTDDKIYLHIELVEKF